MKKIRKNELYDNVGAFLRTKGLELTDGSYANTIRSCCGLLTDAVNLGQQGFEKARSEIDRKLTRAREVIHEKTAPKPPPISKRVKPSRKKAAPKSKATQKSPRQGKRS